MTKYLSNNYRNITLFLILLTILVSFLFSLERDVMGSQYFILPVGDNVISLNTYAQQKITEIARYEITDESVYATDGKKYLAVFDKGRHDLTVYNTESETLVKVGTPFMISASSVLVYDNIVYIGGSKDGTLVIQYNIEEKSWDALAVPSEPDFLGRKAIDDLLTDGEMLFAVDNIVFPKYLLYYKLNGDIAEYSHFAQLRDNSSYEEIRFAHLTDKYLATYSTSLNHGLTYNHISVYQKDRISSSFSIHGMVSAGISSGEREYERNLYDDFVITEDKIILINRDKGLGLLEIKDNFFTTSRTRYSDLVSYDKLETNVEDGENITALRVIPQTNKVVLIIRDDLGVIRYEILKL